MFKGGGIGEEPATSPRRRRAESTNPIYCLFFVGGFFPFFCLVRWTKIHGRCLSLGQRPSGRETHKKQNFARLSFNSMSVNFPSAPSPQRAMSQLFSSVLHSDILLFKRVDSVEPPPPLLGGAVLSQCNMEDSSFSRFRFKWWHLAFQTLSLMPFNEVKGHFIHSSTYTVKNVFGPKKQKPVSRWEYFIFVHQDASKRKRL